MDEPPAPRVWYVEYNLLVTLLTYGQMGKRKKSRSDLARNADVINAVTLAVACLNPTGMGGELKKIGLTSILRQECADVMVLSETMMVEARADEKYFKDYRTFYSCVGHEDTGAPKVGQKRKFESTKEAKWGVALCIRSSIRLGTIRRGEDKLKGRAIIAPLLFDSAGQIQPIWVLGLYAPVFVIEHKDFFGALTIWLKTFIPKQACIIVAGDLNSHLLGPQLERRGEATHYRQDSTLADWASTWGLRDTTLVEGAFDLERHFTYRHHNSYTISRLDYQLTTDISAVLQHRVNNVDRIAGGHRLVSVRYDLFALSKCWKSPLNLVEYPLPIPFDRLNKAQVEEYINMENEWLQGLDTELWEKYDCDQSKYVDSSEEDDKALISALTNICSAQARKIWKPWSTGKRFAVNKEVGVNMGKLTWIRKAMRAMRTISDPVLASHPLPPHQMKEMTTLLSTGPCADLNVANPSSISAPEKSKWFSDTIKKREETFATIKEEQKKMALEAKERRRSRLINTGFKNAAAFRRSRLFKRVDPDCEAVLSKDGTILVMAKLVIRRFEEYYSDLLKGEPSRASPPNESWTPPGSRRTGVSYPRPQMVSLPPVSPQPMKRL